MAESLITVSVLYLGDDDLPAGKAKAALEKAARGRCESRFRHITDSIIGEVARIAAELIQPTGTWAQFDALVLDLHFADEHDTFGGFKVLKNLLDTLRARQTNLVPGVEEPLRDPWAELFIMSKHFDKATSPPNILKAAAAEAF